MNPLRAVLTALKLAPRDKSSERGRSPRTAPVGEPVDIELPGLAERENFDTTDYDVRSLGSPIDPVTDSRAAHKPKDAV